LRNLQEEHALLAAVLRFGLVGSNC
jgi:hypothetical protein